MPQERDSNYPYPTAEDAAASLGGREAKAARNIVARHVTGIPRRAYLMGESDHAPVVRGVADLTAAVYALLDIAHEHVGEAGGGDLDTAIQRVQTMMEDHRCPPATADA